MVWADGSLKTGESFQIERELLSIAIAILLDSKFSIHNMCFRTINFIHLGMQDNL